MELLLPFLHLIFIILTISYSSSSFLQPVTAFRKHDNTTDLEALLHFRAQADPHGVLADNWTANASFCSWVGVRCSRRRQRVTAIKLANLTLQEYATMGTVSRMGDVYSFGILLLETFTGKKPVDSMFGEHSSLREWICKANSIMDVVDKNILKYHGTENGLQKLLQCMSSVIELGMACSKYSPKERIPMTDVARRKLVVVRNKTKGVSATASFGGSAGIKIGGAISTCKPCAVTNEGGVSSSLATAAMGGSSTTGMEADSTAGANVCVDSAAVVQDSMGE